MPANVVLSGIHIYPIKSLRGIALAKAVIARGRIAGDRLWVLTDVAGRFMHQRDYPQMATLGVELVPDGVLVHAEGRSSLHLVSPSAVAIDEAAHVYVRLWRRSAPIRAVGRHADAWFSEMLGVSSRLMAFVPELKALDAPDYELDASLHDATPFHLTSDDSLRDLNARMPQAIPMNRFRPNLVVSGASPYAEDGWRRIGIGACEFTWVRPCTRCAITMTDQRTGARSGSEPLRTLSTYRRMRNEVVFGHYIVATSRDEHIRLGDPVVGQ